jgi:hypothetical protein
VTPADFLSLTVPRYDKRDKRIAGTMRKHEQAIAELAKQGRFFTPVKRPKGFRQMTVKACYYNAWRLAIYGRAQYVEGYAMSGSGFLAHHAWVTVDGVTAIDVTWREPGEVYFGMVFDTKAIAATAGESGIAGAMLTGLIS